MLFRVVETTLTYVRVVSITRVYIVQPTALCAIFTGATMCDLTDLTDDAHSEGLPAVSSLSSTSSWHMQSFRKLRLELKLRDTYPNLSYHFWRLCSQSRRWVICVIAALPSIALDETVLLL